jgi:RES domain-containing protein
VRYLAESPEHAIGEVLSPFRGTDFRPAYLRQGGHQLALVEVALAPSLVQRVPDCTDPAVLARLGLRPDELAHHDRTLTQAIARRLHGQGAAGLRWWSALTGAWHTTVVFTDRERAGEVGFGTPRQLEPTDSAVMRALSVLGIRVR